MRSVTLLLLMCGLWLPLSTAHAQTRERVKVLNVRLGLPAGQTSGSKQICKPGQWSPVYVDLECVRDTKEKLLLQVETTDVDGVITEGSVEITAMVEGDRLSGGELGPLPYLKPGGSYSTLVVRVKGAESGKVYGDSGTLHTNSIEGSPFVIGSLGFNIGTLRLPTADNERDEEATRELRGGWIQTAQMLRVDQMPDQWFGYGSVDVLILSSGGDRTFWELLASKQNASRRRALVEWVRRGGRLIVSIGNNPDLIESFKELREILPATIPADAKQSSNILAMRWNVSGLAHNVNPILGYKENKNEFAWVKMQPREGSHTLVSQVDDAGKALSPVVVQGPHGLGRVTVVGFDLDRSPFVDWRYRAAFWEHLLNNGGYELPRAGAKFQIYGNRGDNYAGSMQGNLDFFEGVPIVSFGWVALFILIYIVLIGPVDYLFLKKVVKRLEWTWVTFPIMVVVVSAGAYFAAYAIKGNDLKINKIDIVDYDLTSKRVDGHTYFTLFSPRIHDYSIAIEPAGDDGDAKSSRWVTGKSHDAAYQSLVSWFGKVRDGSSFSSDQAGLFSKRFRYQSINDPNEPDRVMYAAALERVPIQVWTTKTFMADWTASIDPNNPPIKADLAISPADPGTLIGTITNNLPVDTFTDMGLMWRGKIYDLKDFSKGVAHTITLSTTIGEGNNKAVSDIKVWLNDRGKRYKDASYKIPPQPQQYGYPNAGSPLDPNFRLWPVLFYDASTENARREDESPNAAVRSLDQSWRVRSDRGEQAILVLRVPTKETNAEEMTKSAQSPSRLWLGKLPNESEKRETLQGTLRQETYVRIFIPIKTPVR